MLDFCIDIIIASASLSVYNKFYDQGGSKGDKIEGINLVSGIRSVALEIGFTGVLGGWNLVRISAVRNSGTVTQRAVLESPVDCPKPMQPAA